MLISGLFISLWHIRRDSRNMLFTYKNKELLSFTSGNGSLIFIQLQSRPCSCVALGSRWLLRSCCLYLLCLQRISLFSYSTKIYQDLSNSSQVLVVVITRLYNWCKMLRWLFNPISKQGWSACGKVVYFSKKKKRTRFHILSSFPSIVAKNVDAWIHQYLNKNLMKI